MQHPTKFDMDNVLFAVCNLIQCYFIFLGLITFSVGEEDFPRAYNSLIYELTLFWIDNKNDIDYWKARFPGWNIWSAKMPLRMKEEPNDQ